MCQCRVASTAEEGVVRLGQLQPIAKRLSARFRNRILLTGRPLDGLVDFPWTGALVLDPQGEQLARRDFVGARGQRVEVVVNGEIPTRKTVVMTGG